MKIVKPLTNSLPLLFCVALDPIFKCVPVLMQGNVYVDSADAGRK